MSLTPGLRLGPYEIVSALGAGGMGEVYRARDTKLGRDVAVKVLPEVFATDSERLARFQREAEVLASLNHPNIAAIYGLEESPSTSSGQVAARALVMELVEGETLGEHLERQRVKGNVQPYVAAGSSRMEGLPIAEALAIARQIAEALEAAHEKGIVHRDLKPANVKVRPDGTVKVLDFGLASVAQGPGPRDANLTNSPTLTMQGTQAGIIVGTAGYMSPEQASGKAVDKRADIWAFGVVLWEMLAGRRLFDGETISHTLADVLRAEIDFNKLPGETPTPIRELLRRCLDRNAQTRLRDIGEARIQIQQYLANPAGTSALATSPSAAAPTRHRASLAGALAFMALAVLTLSAVLYLRRGTVDPQTIRFFVSPPEGWSLTLATASTGAPGANTAPLAVSPDGRRLAFLANAPAGRSRLWVRALETLAVQELPGTDGASSPFWSPDSQSLGFFVDGRLKRIDVSGASPVTLCDSPSYQGGTWSGAGVIVFAQTQAPLFRISQAGGIPAQATVLEKGETSHYRPTFLPDGRHFTYRVRPSGALYIGSLDSTERVRLFENPDANNVIFTEGRLLFLRGSTLMAQPFDMSRLALTGDAVPLAEGIQTIGTQANGVFSASESGVLAYQAGSSGLGRQIAWLDRAGKAVTAVADRAAYDDVLLAPDGKRAAVSGVDPAQRTSDIWIVDLLRGLRTRFTFDAADDQSPIWSPDGSSIIFGSRRKGHLDLYRKASSGVGAEELLLADEVDKVPVSWSPDGRFILYEASGDVWVLPLFGDRKPSPFLRSPFVERYAQFSPDGRWVAYTSQESGRTEVYATQFPGPGGKWQISTSGGNFPRWRRDGREILFGVGGGGGSVLAAAVSGRGTALEIGAIHTVWEGGVGARINGARTAYDISPDGERVLAAVSGTLGEQVPITVVVNWQAALKK